MLFAIRTIPREERNIINALETNNEKVVTHEDLL